MTIINLQQHGYHTSVYVTISLFCYNQFVLMHFYFNSNMHGTLVNVVL